MFSCDYKERQEYEILIVQKSTSISNKKVVTINFSPYLCHFLCFMIGIVLKDEKWVIYVENYTYDIRL